MNTPAEPLNCACVVDGIATNIDSRGEYIQPGTVVYDPWACTWACELCGQAVPDNVLQAIGQYVPEPFSELPNQALPKPEPTRFNQLDVT